MVLNRIIKIFVCALFMNTVHTSNLQAAGIESLIMPGPVIEGHAKYEDECSRCHRPFSKQSQNTLCLDCHEEIAEDVQSDTGYHGLADLDRMECRSCHTDHEGRDAKIAEFNRETFDHDQTDFRLQGAHAGVACNACHKQDVKYREAPSACFDCHEEDDAHKGNLGKQCADCHSERGWDKEPEFDHDETDFRLRGKHRDVGCVSCHVGEQYEDTPSTCVSCHRYKDVHGGNYGAKCNECHNDRGWDRISFNHDDTDFPLTGRHSDVKCSSCHGKDVKADNVETDCVSCHKQDDKHSGQYGEKCDACHQTRGWEKVKFDHDRETDFPLRGGHKDAPCGGCHRGELGNETLGETCIDCHRTDDVHAGEEGEQCEQCHSESGWGEIVRFDHDMTRFPLIGIHSVAPCEECHLDHVFTDASLECNSCHEADDVHKRRLGPDCELCHNPNDWLLWEFDHNTQTDFRLEGGHEGVNCHDCHTRPVKKKVGLSDACGNCHRDDDVHDGRFGSYCDRCHTVESFEAVDMRR